jgi:hypothetical protein
MCLKLLLLTLKISYREIHCVLTLAKQSDLKQIEPIPTWEKPRCKMYSLQVQLKSLGKNVHDAATSKTESFL